MVRACTVCGLPLPDGARYCPNCGAAAMPLVETEERKVVTVLFTDLVDSTGLAQRLDAERAREILGRFFDAASEELSALRGRPEKFIGDAVMAVFGLPHVHEDDALRGVRAGLAIRERVRRLGESLDVDRPLAVRTGIETGEAAVGRSPTGQLLVTGSVVNTAARLQSAALPGQVLVGQTTYLLTNANVSYARRRRVRAKGFDVSLEAYAVEDLTPRSARRTIPFVGRASEQAILGQSLGLASTTGRPVLVTVSGEAGIGKSRLADELAAGVSAAVMILRGQARAQSDTATFSPAAAIVADLAGIRPRDDADTIGKRLRDLAERTVGESAVERTAHRLALLFGLGESRDETAFVHEVQTGFISVIDGLSRDHPVLVIFEDVHTLKAPMLDLIERLAVRGDGPRRALVLALARSELLEERPAWGTNSGNAVLIRLDALSPDESVQLARHAGGGRIDEIAALEIAERAGGNPYFIIETTGMLMPSGAGSDGHVARAVPPTVQAVVSARLDALPARLRELARRASVFTYAFELSELAVIDPEATATELQQLEDAEVIVRDPQAGEAQRWRMRHATLKDVVYASLPKRERERLHELVARYLLEAGHPSFAADHLELAAFAAMDLDPNDRTVPDRAVDALLVAGDRARRRMESRTAIDRYERALALAGPEERWKAREARILAGKGESHYWLGEYAPATLALGRAVQLGEDHHDPFALALAQRFLGDIAINFEADVDKAERLHRRSIEAAEELGDRWAVVRSLLFAGWVPWTREQYDEAEKVWRRVLEMADPKDRWARVRALTALSINHSEMSDRDGALQLIDEACALAEESGDRFSTANTMVQKARALDDLGRGEEALPWFDRGIATFGEVGARWEMADARAARGIAKRNLGRLDEAEEDLLAAIRIAEELGDRQLPPWTWRNLARVAELRGDKAAAEELLKRSQEAESRGPH
ncbi:MAG TPA: adenylate/guanylate cyclase domain-containing protein [Candidatus Dormibacteraeota bacterium]|nr:adenylate/guanylate cyclase domain-containing protein [Candidatus Dormibacteraeota bacterium]